MKHTSFSASLPYPPLDGIVPNCFDLQLIRDDFAGITSEFSAIAQYVYHQLSAKGDDFTAVATTLLQIAQVEMRHLNILGSVILKLGGNPRYIYQKNCHFVQWRGDLVDDNRQLLPMLQADLQLERDTIACYARQSDLVTQPPIAAVLRRIILDEEVHVRILETLIGEYSQI